MLNIKDAVSVQQRPVRILQFGEGNFLRAFADYMVFEMNRSCGFNSAVCACNLRKSGSVAKLAVQNCLYTLVVQGLKNGAITTECLPINSITKALNPYENYAEFAAFAKSEDWRIVISNSTEAGIAFCESDKLSDEPPSTFPAKLAKLLFERYSFFKGDTKKGIIVLPCELIEKNGDALKACVLKYAKLWNLPEGFAAWLENSCAFCNTLVDRIVSGYPAHIAAALEQIWEYSDNLAVVAEPYYLWAIQAPEFVRNEIPFEKCGLNVVFTNDISLYRAQKVTLLNAPHTIMAATGLQMNVKTVMDALLHPVLGKFVEDCIFGELLETLDLDIKAKTAYANSVLERFKNPYLKHQLKAISSNAISKTAVRVVPSLREFAKRKGVLPERCVFGLVANASLAFADRSLLPLNAPETLKTESDFLKFAAILFDSKEIYTESLFAIKGFKELAQKYAESVKEIGVLESLKKFF